MGLKTKYLGCYRAFIADNRDPDKIGRCKLKVPEVFGKDLITDWAYPKGGKLGANKEVGDFIVPDIGDRVYAEFEHGDVNKPLYNGSWFTVEGSPTTPALARGKKDSTRTAKGTDTFVLTKDFDLVQEPSDPFSGTYPDNLVIKTRSGHVIEVDDTSKAERIHIYHRTGSSIEFHPDGKVVFRTTNDEYTVVNGDSSFHVTGNKKSKIGGDLSEEIGINETRSVLAKQDITVGLDRVKEVGGSDTETIVSNKTEVIGGSKSVTIVGSDSLVVTKAKSENVLDSYSSVVAGSKSLNVMGGYSSSITGARTASILGGDSTSVTGARAVDVIGSDVKNVLGDMTISVVGNLRIVCTGFLTIEGTLGVLISSSAGLVRII